MPEQTDSDDKPAEKTPPVPVFDVEPKTLPPWAIVGSDFVAQTDVGEVRTSLKFPSKWADDLDGLTMREQMEYLLNARGEEETLERLGEMDEADRRTLDQMFWIAWQQRAGARLGEALRSSAS